MRYLGSVCEPLFLCSSLSSPVWNRIGAFGVGFLLLGETIRTLDKLQGRRGKQKSAACLLKGDEEGDFQGGCLAVDLLWVPHKVAATGSELQGMPTQWEVWMCLPILLQLQWRFYFSLFLLKCVHSAIQPLENILKSILV